MPLVEINPRDLGNPPLPDFKGPLAVNDILSQASILFSGQLSGPETLLPHEGFLYFGVSDGRILRKKLAIATPEEEKYQEVARLSASCKYYGLVDQKACGRPLGLRFDSKGILHALDAYSGVKKIDVKTGKILSSSFDSTIFNTSARPIIFLDDFVLDEAAGTNGADVYYLTDSSEKWEVDYVNMIVLEKETSGRLIKYDTGSKKMTILLEGLSFPNGIELTDDKSAILFNELNRRQTLKHYIRGEKSGQTEVLIANLPGYPDNLRRSSEKNKETYWIALYEAMNPKNPNPLVIYLESHPTLTKHILQGSYNFGSIIDSIGDFTGIHLLKTIGYMFKTTAIFQKLDFASKGLAIEVDMEGKILRSVHSPDGKMTHLSEVRHVEEGIKSVLYLGSYYNKHLGKVVLNTRHKA